MITPIQIPMEVAISTVQIPMEVSIGTVQIPMIISMDYTLVANPEYEGEYEVTPTQETQVLLTAGKAMSGNVTVNPIPQNYGLITWDGSVLTVS